MKPNKDNMAWALLGILLASCVLIVINAIVLAVMFWQ